VRAGWQAISRQPSFHGPRKGSEHDDGNLAWTGLPGNGTARMSDTSLPKAGFIGLGDLGSAIAARLLRSEVPLGVWNRSKERMAPLAAAGAWQAPTVAALADWADILLICVTDGRALEAILFGADGVMHGGVKPRLIVDHSTVHPGEAIEIAERLRREGLAFLDAPVSGGAPGAAAGSLAVMVGGDADDLRFALPILSEYGGKITHIGPNGSGQAMKACNQIINFITVGAIAEALAVGAPFGIDGRMLSEALSGGFADSNMLHEYARGLATGEKAHMTRLVGLFATLFSGSIHEGVAGTLELPLKDLAIATGLVRDAGSAGMLIATVECLFRLLNGPVPKTS
jgi:3-hydroxyisobutyrate dehydrogenase-like beta-hydroxyacid dehydrogenase